MKRNEMKNENYNIWSYWNNMKNIIFEIIEIKNENYNI